ncbi:hypothetical protein KSS87_014212 [Heliosperma pusillum]|nr:hypothetical protein KSS87_014212 [Heliosperma pusillum]
MASHKYTMIGCKIPRDLTEASLSGAGLSIVAALAMVFLFGMELSSYLSLTTSTSVIVDKSPDGEFLRIDFNMSFPALSCEFASVDVSDALGTNRLNITKTIRKFSIDSNMRPTGPEYLSGATTNLVKHDDGGEEDYGEGSLALNGQNFERVSHEHDILVVNFYAPWCFWSNRLKPSWEKAATIIRERHDPEADGRILLGKVDCTEQVDLCRRNHIQGYPSIRVFRKGTDLKDDHGHHEHESYYGDRDTESLVKFFESLLTSIPLEKQHPALEDKSDNKTQTIKRPAPPSGGCRIEGFVRVKKASETDLLTLSFICSAVLHTVPGNLVVSARSGSHSFDASKMNVSHFITELSFGLRLSPRMLSDLKRIEPYLGASHERLSGQSYITQDQDSDANVTATVVWYHHFRNHRNALRPPSCISTLRSGHRRPRQRLAILYRTATATAALRRPSCDHPDAFKTATAALRPPSYDHRYSFNSLSNPFNKMQIEHYLQVVKTEVRTSSGHTLVEEHEYTAHSSLVHSPDIPVAKFHFELSPMQVLVMENPRSFSHFITNVCAIIGGVFTVCSWDIGFNSAQYYAAGEES